MTPETSRESGSRVSRTVSGGVCQTDSSHTAGYAFSRFNACKWQTRREDIMVCLGTRCQYRFCRLGDDQLPDRGSECPWEVTFARRLVHEFRKTFPRPGIGEYLDDYEHHRKEFVLSHLLANRASVRSSLALGDHLTAIPKRHKTPLDPRLFDRYLLALRYRTAAYNRVQTVWDQVPVIQERLREKRIRTLLLQHGYWRPYEGQETPDVDNAPAWILALVDAEG